MSELQPVARQRKILLWIGTVLLWIAVILSTFEGDVFTWQWWLSIIAAVAVTISAVDLSRHPTKS
jgi:hypothetical protein